MGVVEPDLGPRVNRDAERDAPSRSTARPNVLLMTADQLRFDCLGAAGNPLLQTPHLDALAASGIRFANAYTPATICVPARQSILTGQAPTAHGAMSVRSAIPEGRDTLVRRLRDSGYRTAGFGKMHFWPVYADYGLDHLELAEQDGPGWQVDDYHARFLADRGRVDQWDLWDQQEAYRREAPSSYWESYGAAPSELPEELYHSTWIADRTIAWLESLNGRTPFFAWASFIKPHHPFDPPRPYDTLYAPDEVPLPPREELWRHKPLLTSLGDPRVGYFDTRAMRDSDLRRVAALYYGVTTHLDRQVGRILAALDRSGLAETTTVIFTSDHGDYLGQYGLFLKHPNVPYDALARVPLVVRSPSTPIAHAGSVSEALVSTMDLLPTGLTQAALDLPDYVQGRDLSALLQDPHTPFADPVFVESGPYRAVRTPRYKFIHCAGTATGELYDVLADPYETTDLAPQRPAIVEEHRRLLLDWAVRCAWDRYRHDTWELA